MNSLNQKTNYTITLIRVIACMLIIWNHISSNMLGGFLNKWYWANIGVQIFFFMSGYLYGGREIAKKKEWIIRQGKKIIKPYYLSLFLLIPLVYILDRNALNVLNISTALLCLQGFGLQIDGLGQHWFISYILVCYLLTALLLSRLKFSLMGGGKFWFLFISTTFVFQVITIPLAFLIKFKSAYIMTFVIGYCYKVRFVDNKNVKEQKVWEWVIIIVSLLGIVVRYFLEMQELHGIYESMSDLTIQYTKLFWACAIFVLINKMIPQNSWYGISNSMKQKLVLLAGCTYEIYLVHEFFVHEPYTSMLGSISLIYKIGIVLLSFTIATVILRQIEKIKLKI